MKQNLIIIVMMIVALSRLSWAQQVDADQVISLPGQSTGVIFIPEDYIGKNLKVFLEDYEGVRELLLNFFAEEMAKHPEKRREIVELLNTPISYLGRIPQQARTPSEICVTVPTLLVGEEKTVDFYFCVQPSPNTFAAFLQHVPKHRDEIMQELLEQANFEGQGKTFTEADLLPVRVTYFSTVRYDLWNTELCTNFIGPDLNDKSKQIKYYICIENVADREH